ncbi:Bax inhibitor-1/YccA family protein [Solitalea koreensis]|uniref:Uncharacterized membrane protein, YccA/Bax inhibitor family n=1 Tax=Solitalea koreensis TaxID=543615 RepID=A0A521ACV2_9SPHI|nr:Bax inhibitor-1/YccA family protein [Solitalea koreensis]SMO32601.1 Uncharacterized membrane protein, YccA/Bax inhibitor family [Solitalea koreensis]
MAFFESSNPTLKQNTFNLPVDSTELMTVSGTVRNTFLLLVMTVIPAMYTWYTLSIGANPATMMPLAWGGMIGALVLSFVTMFKKEWSPITAPLYALGEGLALGLISFYFDARFPGIAIQAIMLTFGVLFSMLMAYRFGWLRATERFRQVVMLATMGIMICYLINFVMSFFGASMPMIHEGGLIGIGFSMVVVIVASLNLILDFDFIERGAAAGAPKYMEWYGAFSLLVTIIWLYLEILRLLSKLNRK